jgi:hypothetical protein
MNLLARALGHLIRCRDVTRLVSQLQDRDATRWERFRLRMHLAACAYCSRFERQIALLHEAMHRYRSGDYPSEPREP